MKNILDKIAELPSGVRIFHATPLGTLATPLFTDDLKALASHLKRMEEMLNAAYQIKLISGPRMFRQPSGDGWNIYCSEDSLPDRHPDALSAFESLKEQK